MAATPISSVRICEAGQKRELVDDLLADSQDFECALDDGRSLDGEQAVCKKNKVGASTTEIVQVRGAASSSAGGIAVVPVLPVPAPLEIRNVGIDVGEMVNQMLRMQQHQMENQMRMQQTFLEQVVRLLPVGGGQVDPGVRDPPGVAFCAPTQVDASGLTPEQWELCGSETSSSGGKGVAEFSE